MNYPAYEKYKDSGVEWFDKVPSHWAVRRLKYDASYWVSNVDKVPDDDEEPVRLCNYTDVYYNDYIHADMDFMETTATPEEIRRFGLKVGDVLITKDSEDWRDIAVPALVTETADDLVCGYHLAMVRGEPKKLNGAFLFRCFQAASVNQQFQVASSGITRYGLPKSAVGEAWLPIPPLDEQQRIANFLDAQTARIDALIAKKLALVEKLKERRAALISKVVTRGLPPEAARAASLKPHPKLKPTGIDWLGEVPEHWEVEKFSRVIKIAEGQVDPEQEPYLSTLLIAPNHIESQTGKLIAKETAADQAAESGKYLCREGDVVYSKIRPALAKATIAPTECLCSADMYPMRGNMRLINSYLLFLLLSRQFTAWSVLEADRVAMPKINRESLAQLQLPLPPVEEQKTISNFLNVETQHLDEMLIQVELAISRLLEYRAAIISSAITGNIDLRGTRA